MPGEAGVCGLTTQLECHVSGFIGHSDFDVLLPVRFAYRVSTTSVMPRPWTAICVTRQSALPNLSRQSPPKRCRRQSRSSSIDRWGSPSCTGRGRDLSRIGFDLKPNGHVWCGNLATAIIGSRSSEEMDLLKHYLEIREMEPSRHWSSLPRGSGRVQFRCVSSGCVGFQGLGSVSGIGGAGVAVSWWLASAWAGWPSA